MRGLRFSKFTLLLSAGAAVALGFALYAYQGDSTRSSTPHGPLISLPALDARIEGEALVNKRLEPLSVTSGDNIITLSASGPAQMVMLRLVDQGAGIFHDIELARALRISGLTPYAKVTLQDAANNGYTDIPADWNGRIALPAPRQYPATLRFETAGTARTLILHKPMAGDTR